MIGAVDDGCAPPDLRLGLDAAAFEATHHEHSHPGGDHVMTRRTDDDAKDVRAEAPAGGTDAGALPPEGGAVLITRAGASYEALHLAATAAAGAADAMELARRGPGAVSRGHWTLVADAETLLDPDLGRALADTGLDPALARAMAQRLASLIAAGALDGLDPDAPVGVADARGVPPGEHRILRGLGLLALDAADVLGAPPSHGGGAVAVLLDAPEPGHPGPWAGLLAARLDLPEVPEHAVLTALVGVRACLVAHCAGARDWLDPAAEVTTIDVRTPREHPGLPLAFTPFVVDDASTCRALAEGAVPSALLAPSRPVRWTH